MSKYCTVCGAELIIVGGKKLDYYDGETGKALYHLYKKCPRKRWWNFHDYRHGTLHPDGHHTWFYTD